VISSVSVPGSGTPTVADECVTETRPPKIENESPARADGQAHPIGQGRTAENFKRTCGDRRATTVAIAAAEDQRGPGPA